MSREHHITVTAAGADDYLVQVGTRTEHRVRATPAALARIARPDEAPEDTIVRAFQFLLQRESPESILRRFALEDIARYFPDFWAVMASPRE